MRTFLVNLKTHGDHVRNLSVNAALQKNKLSSLFKIKYA